MYRKKLIRNVGHILINTIFDPLGPPKPQTWGSNRLPLFDTDITATLWQKWASNWHVFSRTNSPIILTTLCTQQLRMGANSQWIRIMFAGRKILFDASAALVALFVDLSCKPIIVEW